MLNLNLIDKSKSDIGYKIISFPDGEKHIVIGNVDRKQEVCVLCRIACADDLFVFMQIGDILNRMGVVWSVQIYYLMSMRMDRVINFDESFSLKVVTDAIKCCNPSCISVCHPHSRRTMELLGSDCFQMTHPNCADFKGYQLCYPDKGAFDRYGSIYASNHPVLIGKKVRNKHSGAIEEIEIENPEEYKGVPVMVVDDLCDAGGTFCGIASAIRNIDKSTELEISVIHMVNQKGIDNLSSNYNKVYFTNSYKDWVNLPENCTMFDIAK